MESNYYCINTQTGKVYPFGIETPTYYVIERGAEDIPRIALKGEGFFMPAERKR